MRLQHLRRMYVPTAIFLSAILLQRALAGATPSLDTVMLACPLETVSRGSEWNDVDNEFHYWIDFDVRSDVPPEIVQPRPRSNWPTLTDDVVHSWDPLYTPENLGVDHRWRILIPKSWIFDPLHFPDHYNSYFYSYETMLYLECAYPSEPTEGPPPTTEPPTEVPLPSSTPVPTSTPDPYWWLEEFSKAQKPPLEVDIHIRVEGTTDFDAFRICFDGLNCQETASTELYYTWNTYGWSDGSHTLSIQYRRHSDEQDWNRALQYEEEYYLSPDRSGFAPCDGGEGATLRSGSDCVRLDASQRDLHLIGWGDRSDLSVSVAGLYEAWVFDGVDFQGIVKVVESGQDLLVGGNVSSVDLRSASPTPPPVPTEPFTCDENTVALYHFNEGSGSTVTDACGAVNGTKDTGVSWTTGQFDTALSFANPPDGRGVDFGAPAAFDLCPMSVEAWLRRPVGSGGGRVAGQLSGGGNTGQNKWLLDLQGNRLRLEIWSAGGSQSVFSYLDISDADWHLAMFTYDCGNTGKLYLDNELVGTINTAGVWPSGRTTVEIGSAEGIGRFNGDIDEVRISNIVRVPEAPATPPPTIQPSPTAAPTFSPTPTPDIPENNLLYLSSSTGGTVGGISFNDEDILAFDMASEIWSIIVDSSDLGVTADLNALHVLTTDTILVSFSTDVTIPGLGSVDDSDILLLRLTSAGENTVATFEWYVDGSDVGLTTSGEDIDAIGIMTDGRLTISTSGSPSVPGVLASDEDLLALSLIQPGEDSIGTWELIADNSDVGLANSSYEDVSGVSFDPASGDISLTTRGPFSVEGSSGSGADIFVCSPESLGKDTSCNFGPGLLWDGSEYGFGGEVIDAFSLALSGGLPSPDPTASPMPTSTATSTPPPTATATLSPETPTSVPTDTPAGADDNIVLLTSTTSGSVGGISFGDEDVVSYAASSSSWAIEIDLSDVGVTGELDALLLLPDGGYLISFDSSEAIPGLGDVDASDIVKLVPVSIGNNTNATFEWIFDGSDVGLDSLSEDIDAIGLSLEGHIVISTSGDVDVPGVSGTNEDLLAFNATGLGENTSGTWEMYLDASDVALDEDVNGLWIASDSGDIYLTFDNNFSIDGISGDEADVLICNPLSLGENSACTFGPALYWDGSAHGYGSENLNGLSIGR